MEKAKAEGQDSSAQKQFLMGEMTNLEAMKKELPPDQGKEQHLEEVGLFVVNCFTNADKTERTCETITKENAQ